MQVKRLLKKQVVRIMSCSPDAQCSRDHSAEDPGKKGGAKAKSETGSASPEETPDGSPSPVEMQDEGPEEAPEAGEQLPPFLLKEGGDDRLHSAEQDADDEAADDTDDTSSVTSSASSTTSSQSGSGTSRKKSIPLSIKNLKRKHKRKKNKITRDFKPGDRYTQGMPSPLAECPARDHPLGLVCMRTLGLAHTRRAARRGPGAPAEAMLVPGVGPGSRRDPGVRQRMGRWP